MRLRTIERRVSGLSSVQRALAELRAVGSVELDGAGPLEEGDAARLTEAGTLALTAGPAGPT